MSVIVLIIDVHPILSVPPSEPRDLHVDEFISFIRIHWNPSSYNGSGISHYELWYSADDKKPWGNQHLEKTSFDLVPPMEEICTFKVYAISKDGIASAKSHPSVFTFATGMAN